jgi:transketolase
MSKCRECSGGRRFHGRPLIATGSEVAMTVDAYEQLTADGIKARVVSMPSWELFDKQPRSYRDEVLPPSVTARVSVVKGGPSAANPPTSPSACSTDPGTSN